MTHYQHTLRPVTVDYLTGQGPAAAVRLTVPAGTRAAYVRDLHAHGGGWVVDDIAWLVAATGNSHDPHYRYLVLPALAFQPETPKERQQMQHIVHVTNIPASGGTSTSITFASYTKAVEFAAKNGAQLIWLGQNLFGFENYAKRTAAEIEH
jgi:hypothetical protein